MKTISIDIYVSVILIFLFLSNYSELSSIGDSIILSKQDRASSFIFPLSIIHIVSNANSILHKQYLSDIRNNDVLFVAKSISLLISHLSGNCFILSADLGCENQSIDQGRSYYGKSISITNCVFKRFLSYSSDGGVAYVSSGSYSMNISYSIFYNCACSGRGGAIYFVSNNSSLQMICANRCSASSYDHFAFCSASNENQMKYLSVSNCSHSTLGMDSMELSNGHQCIDCTNSSMNNAIRCPGIYVYTQSSFASSHCTFSNNNSSDSRCICFSSISGMMLYANIVHNNSPSRGVVDVIGGTPKIMYCIFQYNSNYLFCVLSGSLEVIHSIIDHPSSSFSTSTAVSTSNNNSLTNRMTYQIQFFRSFYCNADIPLSTPLNTIEKTPFDSPQPSLEMTPIISKLLTPYRTYGEHMENILLTKLSFQIILLTKLSFQNRHLISLCSQYIHPIIHIFQKEQIIDHFH